MNKLSFILLILGMFLAESLAAQSSCPPCCTLGASCLKNAAAAVQTDAAPVTVVAVGQNAFAQKASVDRPGRGKVAEDMAAAGDKKCVPISCDPAQCAPKPACSVSASRAQSLMAILVQPAKE